MAINGAQFSKLLQDCASAWIKQSRAEHPIRMATDPDYRRHWERIEAEYEAVFSSDSLVQGKAK